jgi:hypothetical protein
MVGSGTWGVYHGPRSCTTRSRTRICTGHTWKLLLIRVNPCSHPCSAAPWPLVRRNARNTNWPMGLVSLVPVAPFQSPLAILGYPAQYDRPRMAVCCPFAFPS